MYAPPDLSTVDAGRSLLLAGRDERAVRESLLETLADPAAAVVLLDTADGAAGADELAERGVARDALGVVDASSAEPTDVDAAAADAVAGPDALSALGVAASEQLERLEARYDRLTLGLDGVSTMLDAQAVPAVFRFLHVLEGRANAADAVFVATLDRTAHENETVHTIAALFDEVVEVTDESGPSA